MTGLAREIYRRILPRETRMQVHKLMHRKGIKRLRTNVFSSEKGDFSLKPYDDYRCIFVHITKTAGTSVAKALFGYLPYHYTAIDYRVIYGKNTFDDYFKFAFVRNPWDRLYSAYRYLKSGGWNDEDRGWSEKHLSEYDDFNTFVMNWLTRDNIMKHIHFMPQYYFVCDDRDRLLLDYVAYFETINEDFDTIASKLSINAKLSHHNASPSANYLTVYNDEARLIVADVYSKDIEMFGYDFDKIKNRRVV